MNENKLNQFKDVMASKQSKAQHTIQMQKLDSLEKSLVSSMRQLVLFLDGKTTKTEVINQLKSVNTPDIEKVVKAVEKLDSSVRSGKLDITPLTKGLDALEKQLKQLPKSFPEAPEQREDVKVTNLAELDIEGLKSSIKGLKLEAPKVEVKPELNIEAPDLEPLKNSLLDVVNAVKAIPQPEKTDTSKVEKQLEEANKKLQKIVEKPMGGGAGGGSGTSFKNSSGNLEYVELTPDGKIPVEAGATSTYQSRFDTTSTANAVYLGKSVAGTDESDALWQIKKVDTSAGSVMFADDETTFTKVWNDRTTYGY